MTPFSHEISMPLCTVVLLDYYFLLNLLVLYQPLDGIVLVQFLGHATHLSNFLSSPSSFLIYPDCYSFSDLVFRTLDKCFFDCWPLRCCLLCWRTWSYLYQVRMCIQPQYIDYICTLVFLTSSVHPDTSYQTFNIYSALFLMLPISFATQSFLTLLKL